MLYCIFKYCTLLWIVFLGTLLSRRSLRMVRKLSDIESKFHNLLYLFSENLIKQDAKQFQKNNFDQPFKISFKEAWAMTSWNNFYKMWRHKMMVAYSMKISWADFLKGLLFMLVVSSYILATDFFFHWIICRVQWEQIGYIYGLCVNLCFLIHRIQEFSTDAYAYK